MPRKMNPLAMKSLGCLIQRRPVVLLKHGFSDVDNNVRGDPQLVVVVGVVGAGSRGIDGYWPPGGRVIKQARDRYPGDDATPAISA